MAERSARQCDHGARGVSAMVWASVHNAGNASVCHREAAVRRGPSDAGPCGLQGARALSLDDTEFTRSCSWDVQARRALGSGGQALRWWVASPHTCPCPRCHSQEGAIRVVTRRPPLHVQTCAPHNTRPRGKTRVPRGSASPGGLPWGPCSAPGGLPWGPCSWPGRGRTSRDGSQSPCCPWN